VEGKSSPPQPIPFVEELDDASRQGNANEWLLVLVLVLLVA
jgi:hypothetical protein